MKTIEKWLRQDLNRAVNITIAPGPKWAVQIHYRKGGQDYWSDFYFADKLEEAFDIAVDCESPE